MCAVEILWIQIYISGVYRPLTCTLITYTPTTTDHFYIPQTTILYAYFIPLRSPVLCLYEMLLHHFMNSLRFLLFYLPVC